MMDLEQRESALRYADEQRIYASHIAQMGFKKLAAWIRKNADAAMKWAARKS